MAEEATARTARAMIVITAKAPLAGAAKTRLIPAISPERAAALHQALLTDTIRLVQSVQDVEVALICPRGHRTALAALVGEDVRLVQQRGDGLAAALSDVFERFTGPDRRRVIAFNSDSPHVPAAVLREAVAALDDSDLVVGPTPDGGYYLVGARTAHAGLFSAGLGTNDALSALLVRAHALGLTTWRGPEFFDVDRPDDLERLRAQLRDDPGRASATAALLAGWDGSSL